MSKPIQISLRVLGLLITFAALVIWYFSGYMPGTLYFDESGSVHGTGVKRYWYPSGDLKLEEDYSAGHLSRSRWYRPDGSLFAETRWHGGTNVGYYLRDDGSVRAEYEYLQGLAHGKATFYDEHGNVEKTAMFREGVEVKPQ